MWLQDLGWNDIGFHNPLIDSPNIDALASVGIELTDYHVYKVCSPTRAAILTGRLPNRAGLHNFISHDKPDAISDRYILLPQALKAKGCERLTRNTLLAQSVVLGSPLTLHIGTMPPPLLRAAAT